MEAKLHKLKVTELKELLAKNSLVQTGKKDELIKRLLDNNVTIEGEGETEAEAEDLIESPSEETPGTAAPVAVPPAAQPSTPVVDSSSAPAAATTAASSVTAPAETESTAVPALTPDQLAMKARAERFGVPFNPNPTPRTAAKTSAPESKTAAAPAVPAPSAKGEKKGAIDSAPLGVSQELLAKRAAKFGLPEKKAPVKAEVAVAVKPEEKKKPEPEITPEMAARIAEDEEKKRKRAEKFGTGAPATANGSTEPDAKKAKV